MKQSLEQNQYDEQHELDEHNEQLPTLAELQQQLWDEARAHRNQQLKWADIQINRLEDAGKDAAKWRRYRQALRDLPDSTDNPTELVWPKKPK